MITSTILLLGSVLIPLGKAEVTVTVRDKPIQIFTYKPKNYRGERMILVFHGTLRNADDYRDDAIQMADRYHALVVAPKFDSDRFPNRRSRGPTASFARSPKRSCPSNTEKCRTT